MGKDNTTVSAAEGSNIRLLGFIPVTLRVRDGQGGRREASECLYFGDGILNTLVSLTALKNLGCVSRSFPYPDVETASSLTERDDEDYEEDPKEKEPVPREDTPPRPTMLHFPPTEENVPKLRVWLVEKFSKSSFNTSSAPLAKMMGPPMKIHIKDGVDAVAIHKPISIPHHWREHVKKDLDRDCDLGIIERGTDGIPTKWQSRMVVVAKKNGMPRITVDLSPLNKHCHHETHSTETPFNQVSRVEKYTYKSVVDAWNGYHAVELDEKSRNLTAFITPFGRYRYRRAPQGHVCSWDAYTRMADDITKDVVRQCKVVDDTLLYDDSIEGNFFHIFDYLKLCGDNGITFNEEKFQFCQMEVEFAGFRVTRDGIKPSESLLKDIREFPEPLTIKDARRWFGLIEQVAWSYAIGDTMVNFHEMTKPTCKTWQWTPTLREEFNKSKMEIIRRVEDGVKTYDLDRLTCVSSDWSKAGIGLLVSQKYCDCDLAKAPRCCKDGFVKL